MGKRAERWSQEIIDFLRQELLVKPLKQISDEYSIPLTQLSKFKHGKIYKPKPIPGPQKEGIVSSEYLNLRKAVDELKEKVDKLMISNGHQNIKIASLFQKVDQLLTKQ